MDAARRLILVVHDDPVIAELLQLELAGEDVVVWEAQDAFEAVKIAARHVPVLAVVDLQRSELSARMVATALRIVCRRALPIIALGATGEESLADLAQLQAFAIHPKPFDLDAVTASIRRAIAVRMQPPIPSRPPRWEA